MTPFWITAGVIFSAALSFVAVTSWIERRNEARRQAIEAGGLIEADETWLFGAAEFKDTPIYDATAAYEARKAAASIDEEWRAFCRGGEAS